MIDNQLMFRPATQPAVALPTLWSPQPGAHRTMPSGADRVDIVSSRVAGGAPLSASVTGARRSSAHCAAACGLGSSRSAARSLAGTVVRSAVCGLARRHHDPSWHHDGSRHDDALAALRHSPFATADASAFAAHTSMPQGFAPLHLRSHPASA